MSRSTLTAFVMAVLMLVAAPVFAQGALPALDELHPGEWTTIPVPGATCALGTPYSFFVRPADPSKLLIHFQGGGACWNGGTCGVSRVARLLNFTTFDAEVSPLEDEIGGYRGIFDFNNDENPVADYSFVVVPYCTGDLHTGSASATFNNETIRFDGSANTRAVLDWTYENYQTPEQVFVNGSSAGGYAAAFHAAHIFREYPESEHVLLGDASVGVTANRFANETFGLWSSFDNIPDFPSFGPINPLDLNTDLYRALAVEFPDARLAQLTSSNDSVQSRFYGLGGGNGLRWTTEMRQRIYGLLGEVPDFRAYVAWGDVHVFLPRPELYTYQVNGVRMVDWLRDLVNGDATGSPLCANCRAEELYTP